MRLLSLMMESYQNPPEDKFIKMFRESFGHIFDAGHKRHVAVEEASDGKAIREIEHTIYARLTDQSQLKKASSMEKHEQWEIKISKSDLNAGKGGIRVRKTEVGDGAPEYVLTTKVVANDAGDKIELPIPTNEDNFQQIKFLAERGMIKHRYHFPVVGTELVWEVDMFPKQDGEGYHEWCKIDLEVNDRETPIPELPLNFEEVIMPKGYGRQDDAVAEEQITKIYDQCFLARNPFLLAQKSDAATTTAEPQENVTESDPEATSGT